MRERAGRFKAKDPVCLEVSLLLMPEAGTDLVRTNSVHWTWDTESTMSTLGNR